MGTHVHQWLPLPGADVAAGIIRYCPCGMLKVKEFRIGERTISMTSGNLLRWSATKASTVITDVGMDTTTGRPSYYVGSVTQAGAHTDELGLASPRNSIYGTGADGAYAVAANTTLAQYSNVMHYSSLSWNNAYYLENNTNDYYFAVYCTGTITTNTFAGSLTSLQGAPRGTGGTGGASVNQSGPGASGGRSRSALLVCANAIAGVGRIQSMGEIPAKPTQALTGAAAANGQAGTAGTSAAYYFGISVTASGGGGGGAGLTTRFGGAAGAAANTVITPIRRFKDIIRFIKVSGDTAQITYPNEAGFYGGSGGGGGSGASNTGGNTPSAGGGGGGGGGAYVGTGGAGGLGGNGSNTSGGGPGGGGGGGGGSGSLLVCFTTTSAAATIVTASGGNGGEGGNNNPVNFAGGSGGGGGGGGGGVCVFVGPSGYAAVVSAAGGIGGAGGSTNANAQPNQTAGATGSAGGTGVPFAMTA